MFTQQVASKLAPVTTLQDSNCNCTCHCVETPQRIQACSCKNPIILCCAHVGPTGEAVVEKISYDIFNVGYVLKLQNVLQHLQDTVQLCVDGEEMTVGDAKQRMIASGFWKGDYCYGKNYLLAHCHGPHIKYTC